MIIEKEEVGRQSGEVKTEFPKTYTNSIYIELVSITAVEFEMGSPLDEMNWYKNEKLVHKVKIEKAFYLGKCLVTQKQWVRIMGNNPSRFVGEENPVDRVSWASAQEFIKKLNEIEVTDKYRLPYEAEWEYACRADTTARYSFGDNGLKMDEYGYCDNLDIGSHPVNQKRPNPWGLYDMHGNVWEWVQYMYHDNYEDAPANGSA
ncbi:MAG: formylglycine-generating enzyme family protein [Methanosarcinales archaeon]|nr:formylglycine-generating enzyme family protein [Methanosarcinales archaeon]